MSDSQVYHDNIVVNRGETDHRNLFHIRILTTTHQASVL